MIRNENRTTLLENTIQKNPGIQFRELMRSTGMKNGVLSHYLLKLEKKGIVQVKREPRQTRYFPLDVSEKESTIITSLRRETPRRILQSLMLNKEGLEFNQIVEFVSKAPSTVSLYLSQLVKEGTVRIFLEERKRKYAIQERKTVESLIEDYQPGLVDRAATGFEDIINAL